MGIVDTVIDAIVSVPNLVPVVFDGSVPKDPPKHYIVVYADAGVISSASIEGDSSLRDVQFQFRYVGVTAGDVRRMQQAVRSVIVDKSFESDGWLATFDPDYRHVTGSIEADESIPGRIVMTGFDNFTAQCRPA